MSRNTLLIWRLGIASLSLLTAIAVYRFTRFYPPEVLEPFQVAGTDLATYTGTFGSAPFIYTLALFLIIGACRCLRRSSP